ncbi:MAG: nitroreductase family protein [Acidimicrobiia bacterium]
MTNHSPPLTNATIDLMRSHVSVRSFTNEPVSDELLDVVLDAARRAPTSSNWQTYSIIVVRDPDKKRRLAELAGGQGHIEASQAFLAFAADVHRVGIATSLHGVEPATGLNNTLTPVVDAAIVGEAAQVAAESFGLGAVMVGGMRRDATGVAEVLGLPEGVFVVYGMSVGWPAADPREHGLKPRLPSQLVVHTDGYSDEGAAELIEQYNSELAAFYDSQGRNTDAASAWTGPVARGAANPSYPDLRDALDAMGFGFD